MDESKIAVKANQLIRLLARILKKEYDEVSKFNIPPSLKRRRSNKKDRDRLSTVSPDQTIPSPRNNFSSPRDQRQWERMCKKFQLVKNQLFKINK